MTVPRAPRPLFALLAAPILLCACGDRPEQVAPVAGAQPPGGALSGGESRPLERPGMGRGDQPPGHPLFAGEVILERALKNVQTGFLFVTVRAVDGRTPILARRYDVSQESSLTATGFKRVLFSLSLADGSATDPSEVPDDVVLDVWYDPDGKVETEEGVSRKPSPVRKGDVGLEVRLDGRLKAGPGPARRPADR